MANSIGISPLETASDVRERSCIPVEAGLVTKSISTIRIQNCHRSMYLRPSYLLPRIKFTCGPFIFAKGISGRAFDKKETTSELSIRELRVWLIDCHIIGDVRKV